MKIAILAVTNCLRTSDIISYFKLNNLEIDCVVIEKNYRKKFSASEKIYRATHDKYNRESKKYSLIRRITRYAWDYTPIVLKKMIIIDIGSIPFLRKFSISNFCRQNNIQTFEVKKHSSNETKKVFEDRDIDYVLMVSSNWLLKEPIISMKQTKIINAHSGWLPKHKGLDSIPWSILEGDPIGLTTHFIDSGIDSGEILKFYQVQIEDGDSYNMLNKKIGDIQPFAFADTLRELANDNIVPKPQDNKFKPHKPMSYDELCKALENIDNRN